MEDFLVGLDPNAVVVVVVGGFVVVVVVVVGGGRCGERGGERGC